MRNARTKHEKQGQHEKLFLELVYYARSKKLILSNGFLKIIIFVMSIFLRSDFSFLYGLSSLSNFFNDRWHVDENAFLIHSLNMKYLAKHRHCQLFKVVNGRSRFLKCQPGWLISQPLSLSSHMFYSSTGQKSACYYFQKFSKKKRLKFFFF